MIKYRYVKVRIYMNSNEAYSRNELKPHTNESRIVTKPYFFYHTVGQLLS